MHLTAPAHTQHGFISPRTFAIIIVLIGLLAIPIWWGKRNKPKPKEGAQIVQPQTSGQGQSIKPADIPATNGQVASPDRLGFSLGHGKFTQPGDVAHFLYATCDGEPKDAGNASGGLCNAQVGDTSCRLALPILCIQKDNSTAQAAGLTITPAQPVATSTPILSTPSLTTVAGTSTESTPANATETALATARAAAAAEKDAAEQAQQVSWASGLLGATAPVAGFVVQSLAAANARCVAELGSGWRMATLGDAASGKGLVGKRGQGLTKSDTRLWAYSEGKKANCWDPS